MVTRKTSRPWWVHLVEFSACYSLVLIPMLLMANDITDGDEFYKSLSGMLPKMLDMLRELRNA